MNTKIWIANYMALYFKL